MRVVDKLAVGVQAGVDTLQAGGRKAAEEGIRVGGDKAALASFHGASVVGGVGIAAAISAAVSQMEYEDRRKDLRKLYKEELAAQLGKSENKVRDRDIHTMEKHNSVIAEQMKKERKTRNLRIGTTFAGTLVSLAVVAAAIGADMFGGMGTFTAFAAKAVMAMGTYTLVSGPLERLGDRVFNMHEKTAHERIESIHKAHRSGKTVTQERIFAVFAHANKDLAGFIEAKYGNKYDELNIADRMALTETIGSKLGIPQLADDINHGRIKATELAFAVEGKLSGVLPKPGEEPTHGVLSTIKNRLHHMGERISGHHHHQEPPAASFAERSGRTSTVAMGHVQRLEEARARDALAAQQR